MVDMDDAAAEQRRAARFLGRIFSWRGGTGCCPVEKTGERGGRGRGVAVALRFSGDDRVS